MILLLLLTAHLLAISSEENAQAIVLTEGARIFFQGDSITDCDRDRRKRRLDYVMGQGYPNFIAAHFTAHKPEYKLFFSNHAISGATLDEMHSRWKWDGLDNKPDVLSVLIGINDVWRAANQNQSFNHTSFEATYSQLIADQRKLQPQTKLLFIEPFVRPGSHTTDRWALFSSGTKKMREIVHRIAERDKVPVVRLQKIFDDLGDKAIQAIGSDPYVFDGVHPTVMGQRVIADEWMRVVNIVNGTYRSDCQWSLPHVLRDGGKIIFDGDSITDGNRDKRSDQGLFHLGNGYPLLITGTLSALYPHKSWTTFNKAWSGNVIGDVAGRWANTIAAAPTLVSILVGINDISRAIDEKIEYNYTQYELTLTGMLSEGIAAKPDIKYVLCEPFITKGFSVDNHWEEYSRGVKNLQEIVRRLGKRFNAAVIPFQKVLEEASQKWGADHWMLDGIHPFHPGNQLMADAWIEGVNSQWTKQ